MKTSLLLMSCPVALWLAGCSTQPVSFAPVGPAPNGLDQSYSHGTGYLKVYSDTTCRVVGDGPPYYPHTGYNLYDLSGRRVRYVANHIGDMDEAPTPVRVAAGIYKVIAESSSYGRVTVPVVIEAGQITELHLDRGWRPVSKSNTNAIVHLPDGEAVGWKGPVAKVN